MAFYRALSHIGHNGKNYAPGDVIQLSEEQAAQMPWAVELATEKVEEQKDAQPADAPPKFRFRAVKNFHLNKDPIKQGQELELDMETAQDLGAERIELIDQEKYQQYIAGKVSPPEGNPPAA